MAVSGEGHRRYGGNTTCFHAEVEPGHHLVVDCGTGMRTLQHAVAGRGPQRFTVLLTHYHWDHIQGLPVFMPLFEPGHRFEVHGPAVAGRSPREVLGDVIRPPWWPVTLGEIAASLDIRAIAGPVAAGGVRITHSAGSHPQGVVAYRLEGPARSIVIATDHECGDSEVDEGIVALADGADVLVHDAQYTPEEAGTTKAGWGHSSYRSAVEVAKEAGVHRLVLTSHDPDRSDAEIDRLRGAARAGFPHTDAAYEGMTLPL